MPIEDSKVYNELKGKLENLDTGIKKHSSEENYPSNISTSEVEAQIAQLIVKRKSYVDADTALHLAAKDYNDYAEICETLFSLYSTRIYGQHGKYDLAVADYGLKPYKKPPGRKPGNSKPGTN